MIVTTVTGIMILFGRDEVFNELQGYVGYVLLLCNQQFCNLLRIFTYGIRICISTCIVGLYLTENRIAEKNEGVQALDIRESLNPFNRSDLYSLINIITFLMPTSPACLRIASVVPRSRCKVRAHGTKKIKGPIIAYIQTAFLRSLLLAAYPAACLQLRDKAMKASDTRGFGCRTWRLSPSCKSSSPRRHVCRLRYQQV